MKKILAFGCCIFFVICFLNSCDVSYIRSAKNETETEDNREQVDFSDSYEDLENKFFVSDEENPLVTEFFLSDKLYINDKGFSFWNNFGSFDLLEKNISVNLEKISGQSDCGFGIVFCSQEKDELMNVFLVNTNGEFIYGTVLNGSFTAKTEWRKNTFIKKGYEVKNKITLVYEKDLSKNATNDEIFVLLNENKVSSFLVSKDSSKINFGYAVVISPNEKFPKNPVYVRFCLE